MDPLVLDRARLAELLEAACATLSGDWVLLGGALAALTFSAERVTEDIDLVPLGAPDGRRDQLMDFALAQSLPLEAVNSAADFFVRREAAGPEDFEVLREGASARILRPTPTLYIVLKCNRMSEADLADCLAQLAEARRAEATVDVPRILARLDRADGASAVNGAHARRAVLRAALLAV